MAVDKSMADAILGTFRNMAKELDDKGIKGEARDKTHEILNIMEKLALEMNDVGEFSTKLSVDGLYTDFSNWYGKALASGSGSAGNESDEELMKKTLKAYEDSLNTLKSEPSNAHIVPSVQKLVDLGKSGISYPVFLRKCEEQGIFLGLNSPHARPVIEYDIYCAEISFRPVHKEMYQKILNAYNSLCEKSAFGHPNPVEYEIIRQKIEWEYEPKIARWAAIEYRWDKMLDMVHDWVDSFCSFAPYDARWAGLGGVNSRQVTMKNIKRTQECEPGKLKVREEIFYEYFNLKWDDIFNHPTYLNKYKAKMIWYSDECLDLIKDVYKVCKPGAKPTNDQIAKAEDMYKPKRYKRSDMINGEDMKPMKFADWVKRYV